MAPLNELDGEAVRARLAAVENPVTLLFFTQAIGQTEGSLFAKQILNHVASLSDRVMVEEVNIILEKERAASYQIVSVPAIAILKNVTDTGIRFLGAPTGHEFAALVDAIVLASGNDSGLSDESKKLIAQITKPLDIQVFVTPTCAHCPQVVGLAHKMALEHPLIRATCIEATEFLDLSLHYRVTGVPKTIVNGNIEILGAVPESTFVRTVLQGQDSLDGVLQ